MKNKAGYISIKEASRLAGVHPDTIRRLIKQHKGSSNIARGKGSKSPYYLNTDWLMNIYGLNEPHTAPVTAEKQQDEPPTSSDMNNAMSAVVEALTAQLKAKDTQIEQLQKIIIDKEANTTKLQDQFQQLLASRQLAETTITKPTKTSEPETADVVTVNPGENTEITVNKKRNKTTKKTVKVKPKTVTKNSKVVASNKPTKKRWWSRSTK